MVQSLPMSHAGRTSGSSMMQMQIGKRKTLQIAHIICTDSLASMYMIDKHMQAVPMQTVMKDDELGDFQI